MKWRPVILECSVCAIWREGLARKDTGRAICFQCAAEVVELCQRALKHQEKRRAGLN